MGNKELGIADPVYDALRIRSGQSIAPDLGGGTTGGTGLENKIYVWHADGSTIDTFDPDAVGLALALAAAVSGDTIWLPSMTITASPTIPADIVVIGIDIANSIIAGSVTNNGSLQNLSVTGNVTNNSLMTDVIVNVSSGVGITQAAGTLDTVQVIANGTATYAIDYQGGYLYNCHTSYTSGTPTGIKINLPSFPGEIDRCLFAGSTGCEFIDAPLTVISNCQFEGNTNESGLVFTGAGSGHISNSRFYWRSPGSGYGIDVQATGLTLTDCAWTSINGIANITYGTGDRGAYSVEDYHAADIEANVLTRHLTQPTGDIADAGKCDVLNALGTAWELSAVPITGTGETGGTPFDLTAAEAGWSWFEEPHAVYSGGKTFFAYAETDGDLTVQSFDHSTKIITSKVVFGTVSPADDHSSPTLIVRDSDKRLLAYYRSSDLAHVYQRISTNPEDATAWGAAVDLDASIGATVYNYMSPVQLTGEANAPIYLWNADNISGVTRDHMYSVSTDGGATWGSKVSVYVSTNWSYLKFVRNGTTRIDFVATDNHPDNGATSVYHFYYLGGNYYQSDGTLITGGLPFDESKITKVYDGSTVRAWIWDIAIDSAGNPVIAFVRFVSTSDHRYMYARWNGSAWVVNEIAAGGGYLYAAQPHYSGGIALDHADPSIAYLSKVVNGQWEMYRYSTPDGGATWSSAAITSQSSVKNIRPEPIYDHATGYPILFLAGTYTTYNDFALTVRGVFDVDTANLGTVTSLAAGTGITLTPNPIVTTGTIAQANTAVTPGSYKTANLTVDQQGNLTAASNGALDDLSDVDTTGTGTGDVIYNNAGTWQDYPLGIGSRITVSGTKIRFGNVAGGNYLEIDSVTGTLRLVGDATTYDDFRVEASVVKPGATAPNWKAFGPSGNLQALMFEASHHDEAYFELQMPHNWKLGSNIYPHVHWTPVNTTAGNVVWELEYSWANVGGAFGAPGNMATDATAAGGTAWVHKLTDFKESGNNYISGTGKTLSSMLVCRLHRNSNAGSDTLNQDVALLEVDFHYQIDSIGSDEPLVKDASASLLLETGDILLLETGDRLLLE